MNSINLRCCKKKRKRNQPACPATMTLKLNPILKTIEKNLESEGKNYSHRAHQITSTIFRKYIIMQLLTSVTPSIVLLNKNYIFSSKIWIYLYYRRKWRFLKNTLNVLGIWEEYYPNEDLEAERFSLESIFWSIFGRPNLPFLLFLLKPEPDYLQNLFWTRKGPYESFMQIHETQWT